MRRREMVVNEKAKVLSRLVVMVRLLSVLSVAIFLTLLIGGQDRGQQRLGLLDHYAPSEASPQDSMPPTRPQAVPEVVLAAMPVAAPAAPVPVVDVPVAEAPVVASAPAEVVPAALAALPLRYVNTNAINVRRGPSTNDAVVGRLTRNEAVALVAETGDGWYLVRIEGDGIEGYVAARLMTDRAP